ncbi:MAG TPA: hypothetical protein VGM02_06635 [Acidobacteriaceae bacterium]|jgi:hypothetical protein
MQTRLYVAAMMAGVLLPSLLLAKDKPKSTLPTYVLQARTVSVIIDPNAGESLDDPRANEVAQRDVETALANWGRFQPILAGEYADLIIVVRRGTGKAASGTVHDPRQGRRPVAIDPTDTGIDVGVQRGQLPPYGDGVPDASQGSSIPPNGTQNQPTSDGRPHPQAEIGNATSEDSFLVYRGRIENPLDGSPVWRYEAKNALKPHSVPAVDAFRKAIDDAEQAAAKQP